MDGQSQDRQDGDQSDYPDPSRTHHTPYPALNPGSTSSPYGSQFSAPFFPATFPNNHASSSTQYQPHSSAPSGSLPPGYATGSNFSAGSFFSGHGDRQSFVQAPPSGGSMGNAANQYRNLMDRFGLSESAPQSQKPWWLETNENRTNTREVDGAPQANAFLNLSATGQAQPLEDDRDDQDGFDDPSSDEFEVDQMAEIGEGRRESRGRGRPRGRGRGKGRGWKWALKGTEHDPALQKQRDKASGRGSRGSGRGRGRGRKAVDPGREFKMFAAQATQALLAGELDDALEHARRAVQANPEVYQAHSILSEILAAKGQHRDALAAMLSGANTKRDPELWKDIAERTLNLAGDQPTRGDLEQAIYCLSRALEYSGDDYDARSMKMQIFIELGSSAKARQESRRLLKLRPGDLINLQQYSQLCADSGDPGEIVSARVAYEDALNMHINQPTFGDASEQWSHLNIYLELVDRSDPPAKAIFHLKRIARWFLGRRDEEFWDQYESTDVEFDSTHERRGYIAEFQQGRASRDPAKYGDGIPMELRVKLGMFRLKMGDVNRNEAFRHFDQLLLAKDEIVNLYDLFFLVADRLRERGLPEKAIDFYEPIQAIPDVLTSQYWYLLGQSYYNAERFEEAEVSLDQAVEMDRHNHEAKAALAKLYQDHLNDKEKAFALVDQLVAANRKDIVRRERLQIKPVQKLPRPPARPRGPRGVIKRLGLNPRFGSGLSESQAAINYRNILPASVLSLANHDMHPLAGQARDDHDMDGANDMDIDTEEQVLESEEEENDERPKLALWTEKRVARRRGRTPDPEELQRRAQQEDRIRYYQDQASRVHTWYETLKALWPAVESGEDEEAVGKWMTAAVNIYQDFRSIRAFYPNRDRYLPFKGFGRRTVDMQAGNGKPGGDVDAEAGAGEEEGETEYQARWKAPPPMTESVPVNLHGIPFTEYHRIFIDLALLCASQSNQQACYDVLDDGVYGANVFYHDEDLLNTTQAASLHVALLFNDSKRLCFIARWYITRSDMCAGPPYQLLAAIGRAAHSEQSWFAAGPTQKFMLRCVKAVDYMLIPEPYRSRFDWSLQTSSLVKRIETYGEGTGELDPGLLLMYGHMIGATNHAMSALPYYFRAFALQPENISVNLSIATFYVLNGMKRQTDNRHFAIAEGLAFLDNYYNLRVASGKAIDLQEAEFNVARMWHQLGLTHLAVPGYEKVMSLSTRVREEWYADGGGGVDGEGRGPEDFAVEAAFALQTILALVGNDEAASAVTEEWMVL